MKNIFRWAVVLFFVSAAFAEEVKKADLAGSWYPADGKTLKYMLEGYLNGTPAQDVNGSIFAVIAPHAGYQFSGPVAAYGFKALQGRNIKTVVIIGFSHRRQFDGISIYDRGAFETPLGTVEVDTDLAREISSRTKRAVFYPDAFREENSIEIEIPFVQIALKDAKIVPIAFGTQSYDDAELLGNALAEALKGRNDCLIIASTDMSHYHTYDEANDMDKKTVQLLSAMKTKELYYDAYLGLCELCGIMPVMATLIAAEKSGFKDIKILKYANSGDTSGSKDRVVGYLSAVIYKNAKTTSGAE